MDLVSAPSINVPLLALTFDKTALKAFCEHITDKDGELLEGYTIKYVVLPAHPTILMAQFYHHDVYYATIPCYPKFDYGAGAEA